MPEKPQRGEAVPFTARDIRPGSAGSGGSGTPPTTPRQMLERGYEYEAYCGRCDEWRRVDLRWLMRMGQGDRTIAGRRLKCRYCGVQGTGQVKRAPTRR